MPDPKDGWSDWGNHVLAELKRMDSSIDSLRKDINRLSVSVTANKAQLAVYSAIVALVVSGLVATAFTYLGG